MKKHLLKLSFLIVTASMFCACDSFLDKQPSATSDAPITEVSQLLSLYDYVTNTYEYDANCSKNITAEATLTDDAAA